MRNMTRFTMKHLICVAFVMSIALLTQHGVYGGRRNSFVDNMAVQVTPPTSLKLMNEAETFFEPINEAEQNVDIAYNELKPNYRKQPSYSLIWPGLNDLLIPLADYDDIETPEIPNQEQALGDIANDELFNLRFIQKLRLLAENDADFENKRESEPSVPEMVPITKYKQNKKNGGFINEPIDINSVAFKQLGDKKNAQWPLKTKIVRKAARKQYMSPCHFKICNMGRKRQARY